MMIDLESFGEVLALVLLQLVVLLGFALDVEEVLVDLLLVVDLRSALGP